MAAFVGIVAVMLMGIPAMILHECGHIGAALICGVKVKKVGLSRRGLYTMREAGPKWSNIAVSAAGPLVNLLLAIALWNTLTLFAEVNLVACIYNLLPIPNSDGTRILALLNTANVVARPGQQMGVQM
jgi:Zn-dependent protease